MARPESASLQAVRVPQATKLIRTKDESGYSCQLSGALNLTRDTTQKQFCPDCCLLE
jgi:hypothetical protein